MLFDRKLAYQAAKKEERLRNAETEIRELQRHKNRLRLRVPWQGYRGNVLDKQSKTS